ncbi:triose-phosphate transporter family-domain-containing protein [Cercophora newfieldiana]|uniref:GDP-mannose transporter n=1 Tax=Cercophora newfieldiana TaxID=92897 RepID=A0AA40CNY9_9PEZI|nr:triose-phosphate transporter family-domain-containing protein [Cercophora newfieldiana]
MSLSVEQMQRTDSFSSSSTATPTSPQENGNEKLAHMRFGDDEEKLRPPDELDIGFDEHEDDTLLRREVDDGHPQEETPPPPKTTSFTTAMMWMAVNTIATIGIVFTNKAIFSDPSLKLAQLSFAAFHFFLTWLVLWTISRPTTFAFFVPRRASLRDILPLSLTMALNVILPNLSLAFSSITFYQLARILLTPTVATMNYLLYGSTLPPRAVLALIPACLGVGIVSYYDSLPPSAPSLSTITTTSPLGVLFALLGVFFSSLYTIFISSYHRRLQMSSMQLLLNQAPVAAIALLYVIPFVDVFPESGVAALPASRWVLILLSGLFASLINISQFFIVAQTGPVSSTVVGHVKTCTIVAMGWVVSGRGVGDWSVVGVLIALGGIISYSVVMLREKAKEARR